MLQGSLFKNMPQLETDSKTKQKNKELLAKLQQTKKTASAAAPGTATNVRVTSSNKIIQMIEMIKQTAGKVLVNDGSLECIRTEERLVEYVDKCIANGKVAHDTETEGLDPIVDRLVGTCLYTPGEKSVYIPHIHCDPYGKVLPDQISYEVMARELQRMVDAGVRFSYHNAKFDIRVNKNWLGIRIVPYWCTLIGGNMLNENEPHGLKYLWNKYVNKNAIEDVEEVTYKGLFDKISFAYVPIEIGYIYAAKDTKMTDEVQMFQEKYLDPESPLAEKQQLVDTAKLFKETEVPLIPHIADVEDEGIHIDKEYADGLARKAKVSLAATLKAIDAFLATLNFSSLRPDLRQKLSPEEFELVHEDGRKEKVTTRVNTGSPTQLAILLYDMLGLSSGDREKARGTGEDILTNLANKAKDSGLKEFLENILEYRGIKKLLSTYIEKLPREVKDKTNKLHGSFNQYGAKTGRFSSSDPNLQNIPSKNKDIRKMFVAEQGWVFVGADFSQQEPRVLAHLCWELFGDRRMMDAYLQGKDLYAWMASEIYKVPYEECKEFLPDGTKNPEGKKRRDSVKSIILGLMYGRGTQAIADQLGWTREEAQRVVDMFFDAFPAIKQVIEYVQNMARTKGYVQTVYGRKRRLPDINLPEFELEVVDGQGKPVPDAKVDPGIAEYFINRLKAAHSNKEKNAIKAEAKAQGFKVKDNGGKIADAERQCLNSVIQGTSADITKRAMLALGLNEELKALGFKIILTVHDEIIGKCPEENALKVSKLMEDIMINSCADKIQVPMKCDSEIVRRWYGDDVTKELEEKYAA